MISFFTISAIVKVAEFGGNIEEQPVYCVVARPGNNMQYYAYFNPFQPVSMHTLIRSSQ